MQALRLLAPQQAELQEAPKPRPDRDEVLVRLVCAGICGTDLEIFNGAFPSRPPVTMGHEYAGVVAEVGDAVSNISVGTRVVSPGGWPCGQCHTCLRGDAQHCEDRRVLGSSVNGVFAEYFAVPAKILLQVPEGVDFDEAQSALSLAVCLRALSRIPRSYSRNVALLGSGHLALLMLQLLRRTLGGNVTLFGTDSDQIEIGRELGAPETVDARLPFEDRAGSFDVVIDCAGKAESLRQAVDLAAIGGTLLIAGVADNLTDGLRPSVLYHKELTILGSRGALGHYAEAVRLIDNGTVFVKPLISHRFSLHRADSALHAALNPTPGTVRIVIENELEASQDGSHAKER
jgi:threonine dehydrogenase-like Zn-dependent dehydrogenase